MIAKNIKFLKMFLYWLQLWKIYVLLSPSLSLLTAFNLSLAKRQASSTYREDINSRSNKTRTDLSFNGGQKDRSFPKRLITAPFLSRAVHQRTVYLLRANFSGFSKDHKAIYLARNRNGFFSREIRMAAARGSSQSAFRTEIHRWDSSVNATYFF